MNDDDHHHHHHLENASSSCSPRLQNCERQVHRHLFIFQDSKSCFFFHLEKNDGSLSLSFIWDNFPNNILFLIRNPLTFHSTETFRVLKSFDRFSVRKRPCYWGRSVWKRVQDFVGNHHQLREEACFSHEFPIYFESNRFSLISKLLRLI
jgi:hypothetical protein